MLDLQPEIERHWGELTEAFAGVLRSGRFILGPNVEAFEEEIAAYIGVRHAVGVNSGTDALVIGLRALGIGPGDEVITTPFTFFATPESVSNVGATPVFVDIEAASFNIDPELIEDAITDRTRAILPVHLFGHACEMDRIMDIARRRHLKVIEDATQAMGGSYKGKKLGGLGNAAAFSFFPSKNLGGFGDGGMIVTDDDNVAELSRMLRSHGSKEKYANEILGYNSRLDEMQAALLRVGLGHLDESIEARRRVASGYTESLAHLPGLDTPIVRPEVNHAFHQYTVRLPAASRDDIKTSMAKSGVHTAIYYPTPIHQSPVYSKEAVVLPVSESAAHEVLSLPMGASLTAAEQAVVTATLMAVL